MCGRFPVPWVFLPDPPPFLAGPRPHVTRPSRRVVVTTQHDAGIPGQCRARLGCRGLQKELVKPAVARHRDPGVAAVERCYLMEDIRRKDNQLALSEPDFARVERKRRAHP